MLYEETREAVFLLRPNRFVARVLLDGREETVHVKNTGRCRELLTPGARVILARGENPQRKTAYDLVAVWKGERLINMDSQAPNRVAAAYLKDRIPSVKRIKPEFIVGDSRFDFLVETEESPYLVEVKGVTLEEGGEVFFPDAPTARGRKHLAGLADALEDGYRAAVLFLVQMEGVRAFAPNDRTDPAFGEALRKAAAAGVEVWALQCRVTERDMVPLGEIPVRLGGCDG